MAVRTSLSLSRRSRWMEAGLALVGGIGVALGATDAAGGLDLPIWFLSTSLPVLAATLFLFRRSLPFLPMVLSAALTALSPAVALALLVAAYAMGRYEPRWRLRAAAAVLGCVAVAQPWNVDSWTLLAEAVLNAAFTVLLPGAIGAWVRTRAELVAALRERAERAESEKELLARDAVLTERARIAREMHDAVGHRVSLMVLQAGAIEMAAGDRGRVEQLAENVQVAGRQALDELRQAVGVLRSGDDEDAPLEPQPRLEDLHRLVAEWRSAGMDVALHQPEGLHLDPVTCRAAYRIMQEGLTNAGKHAPGASVGIDLESREGGIVVRVRNGAGRPVHDAPGGGYGLVGLRERVRTLGGRLRAEPRLDGGFDVEAVLPVPGPPGREETGAGDVDRQPAATPGQGSRA